jgi:hypothetical protein
VQGLIRPTPYTYIPPNSNNTHHHWTRTTRTTQYSAIFMSFMSPVLTRPTELWGSVIGSLQCDSIYCNRCILIGSYHLVYAVCLEMAQNSFFRLPPVSVATPCSWGTSYPLLPHCHSTAIITNKHGARSTKYNNNNNRDSAQCTRLVFAELS